MNIDEEYPETIDTLPDPYINKMKSSPKVKRKISKATKARVLQEVDSELTKVIENEGLNPKRYFDIPRLEVPPNIPTAKVIKEQVIEVNEAYHAKAKKGEGFKSAGQSPTKIHNAIIRKVSDKGLEKNKENVLINVSLITGKEWEIGVH